MRLILASNNQHKLAEVGRILHALALPVDLVAAKEVGATVDFLEGDERYLDNALGKALAVHAATGVAALGDDSGIEVDALGGAPGVLSARYGPPGSDDAGRASYLLSRITDAADRGARFVCCLALVLDQHHVITVQ